MSNTRKLRIISGSGRLARYRIAWTGKRRDTGATYVGSSSNADMRRAERNRVKAAAE